MNLRFAALFIGCLLAMEPALAATGVAAYIRSGCDYYIVETNRAFALLEWFGGNTPDQGDILVGDYETYGSKEIENTTRNSSSKVWVENYWLSKSAVIDLYKEKCK